MKVLHKKLLRTLIKTKGQAIAVTMVILCGTACYICFSTTHRNLVLTRDTYYTDYRFADFEIMLERAPRTAVFKLESIPGFREVRGRIVKDAKLEVDGVDESRIGRVISMPNRLEPVPNDICLLAGKYFDEGVQNQVIMSDRFAIENKLKIGDQIRVTLNNKKHTLRIVGLALSPEYIYMIRGIQDLFPSPDTFGILWVPEDFAETALDMKEACNNIVGAVDNPDRLEALLEKAEDILEPYGVFAKLERDDLVSHRFISDEITGLGVSAKIMPAIFLGIASLILLVLLNRMVHNERTQIGLLKAYGYSNWMVGKYYIEFALVLGVIGCVGGFVLGQWLSNGMLKIYVQFYQFPLLKSQVYPGVLVRSMGIAVVFALAGALMAARRAAKIEPAESMRPPAPRFGHRTWLERINAIWQRLTFTWKMIVRNMGRNPFRAGLNVFGVMVSSGLLIVGFFLMDSMEYMLDFQFKEAQREDVKLRFPLERGKDAIYEVARFDHVRLAEPLLEYPFELRTQWRKKDVAIIGIPRNAELQRLMNVQGQPVDIGDQGLVLSQRLADELNAGVGDTVRLKPLMGRVIKEKDVQVSKVVRQYLGATAYMNIDALSRVLDEPFAMNAVLLRTDPGTERIVNTDLKDVPGITAVDVKIDALKSLNETLAYSMNISNFAIIFFAGVIAFSIIYNLTTISLAERNRELASLRVLGFHTAEVGRIMYNENFLLAFLGLVMGIPFGSLLSALIVKAYDTELYRLPFYVEYTTFVYATLLTFAFVVLANLAVRRKIATLDMVEVLKARE